MFPGKIFPKERSLLLFWWKLPDSYPSCNGENFIVSKRVAFRLLALAVPDQVKTRISIAYSYRDDLPENLPQNHCPTMQKVHFRWPWNRLILTRNVTRYSNEPIKYIIVAFLFTFEHGGFKVLRKLHILISQSTDFHFKNYRCSFRFVPFRFAPFRFIWFRFAKYSNKPGNTTICLGCAPPFDLCRFSEQR